jgi:uncharacterized protein
MKFQQETLGNGLIVQSYDQNSLVINGQRYTHSLIFGEQRPPIEWAHTADQALTLTQAEWLLAQCPEKMEVLLLGTGNQQIFPSLEVRRFFVNKRCPIEYMDTQAAARTYNILMGEGRLVIAALLL